MDSQQCDTYAESESTYIRKLLTYSLSATDLRRLYQECNDWDLVTSSCDGTWSTITFNTVARNVTNVLFSRHANDPLIVIDVTAGTETRGGLFRSKSFKVYGAFLGSTEPL